MLSPERKGCITASEIGAIAGNGRFASRDDIMRRKVREAHGLLNEFVGNVATQWGHDNESAAIADLEFVADVKITSAGDNQQFKKLELQSGNGVTIFAGATPDGITECGYVVEVKCPYSLRNKKPNAAEYLGKAPEYLDQMQWQMLVTARSKCIFGVWSPLGIDYIVIDSYFARQEELVLIAMEFQFELNKILADETLSAKYLDDQGAVMDDEEFIALSDAYKSALVELEIAQANVDTAKSSLIAVCTDSTIGCGLQIIKAERKGTVDYAKVPELQGVDLEKYRKKSSTVWTVRVDK
jgi:putative phage-type endonuclease